MRSSVATTHLVSEVTVALLKPPRARADRVLCVVDCQTLSERLPDTIEVHRITQILVGHYRNLRRDVDAALEEAVGEGRLVQVGGRYRLPEYEGEGREEVA